MSAPGNFPDQRRALAAELRRLRLDAELTGTQLADAVGMSQSKVSKLETGRLTPSPEDVEAIGVALKVAARERKRLVEQAVALGNEFKTWRQANRRGVTKVQQQLAALERNTTTFRYFNPAGIPGLLQSAEYARLVLVRRVTEREQLSTVVAARVARQEALFDNGKVFSFVLTEAALRWRLGPPSVQVQQLAHIQSLASLANVEVGVIEWHVQAPLIPLNAFSVYDDQLATVETLSGEVTLRDDEDVGYYLATFNELAELASFGLRATHVLQRIQADLQHLST